MTEESSSFVHSERFVDSDASGTRLCVHTWEACEQSDCAKGRKKKSAIAVIVHGYGAHSCYPTVSLAAEKLIVDNNNVGVCYAVDFAGFGKSEGLRGYIPSSESLVRDLQQLVALARDEQTQKQTGGGKKRKQKVFLVGSSLGGAISILFALQARDSMNNATVNIDGLVLLAPMLSIPNVSTVEEYGLLALSFIAGSWALIPSNASNNEKQYKDPIIREKCENDNLSYGGYLRVQTARVCLEICSLLCKEAHKLTTPFLLIMGSKDVVVDPKRAEWMMDETTLVDSKNKTLMIIEDALHGLLCEHLETRERIMKTVSNWIEEKSTT